MNAHSNDASSIAPILHALGDATRLRAYGLLLESKTPLRMTDIATGIGLDPKILSGLLRHLDQLEKQGLVSSEKCRRERFYKAHDDRILLFGEKFRKSVIAASKLEVRK